MGGPAAALVRAILREGGAVVASANLAGALEVSQRVHGLPVTRASEILDPLFEGALGCVPLDRRIAERAARLRAAYYHRSSRPISLADASLVASAVEDGRIATSDPDVLAVARAASITTIELPGQG